jgi:hypothetical protein
MVQRLQVDRVCVDICSCFSEYNSGGRIHLIKLEHAQSISETVIDIRHYSTFVERLWHDGQIQVYNCSLKYELFDYVSEFATGDSNIDLNALYFSF